MGILVIFIVSFSGNILVSSFSLAFLVPRSRSSVETSFCGRLPRETRHQQSARNSNPSQLILLASPEDKTESLADFAEEETLLRMKFSINSAVDMEEALKRVQKYSQSFPFAVVLPVQPMQYIPTDDGGVNVKFLRKKTQTKDGVEGGIRFFVQPASASSIELIAKRNSRGQDISKMFSEKLIIQSFVKGISDDDDNSIQSSTPPPSDYVSVESVFHKWMA